MFSPKRLVEDAIPSEFKLEPVFEVLSVDSRLGFNIRAEIIRTWFSGKLIIREPQGTVLAVVQAAILLAVNSTFQLLGFL